MCFICSPILAIDTIKSLEDRLGRLTVEVATLKEENKKFIEVKTKLEICTADLTKLKQELLDTKVENNKLKLINDSNLIENFEKSLQDANVKLKEAKIELEKSETYYKEEAESVIFYFWV